MRLALACLASTLAALAATAAPARACSCALPDLRTALPRSDGAIIGRLVSRREHGGRAVHRFQVLEAVKGRFRSTVSVWSSSSGASCGLELRVGDVTGLLLDRSAGRWESSLCAQVAPRRLRAAARPLPAPDGRGPAAFLVGGRFGGVRSIALDARGRTLGYGRGSGSVLDFAVCPGSKRAVELVDASRPYLAVRALPRMRLVARRDLGVGRSWARASYAPAVRCLARDAGSLAVFISDLNRRGTDARLLVVRGTRLRVLWRGTALYGALGARGAYLAAGRDGARLRRVPFATRRASTIARTRAPFSGIWLRPDGRVLVSASRSWLTAIRLDGGSPRVRTAHIGCCGARVVWLSGGRLAVLPLGTLAPAILDVRLRRVGALAGWNGSLAAARGGRIVGVDYLGRVFAAPARGGSARRLRDLPGAATTALAAVPIVAARS